MDNDTSSGLDPWLDIENGLNRYKETRKDPFWKFGGHEFLPVPYVDQLLRVLHRERPEKSDKFCLMMLRWSAPVNDKFTVRAFALPLPLIAPSIVDLEGAVQEGPSSPRKWWSAKLVVARYAAAAWVNLRMLLGPGRLEVEFMDKQLGKKIDSIYADSWIKAIEWVQQQDNHETLRAYLLQVGCHRYLHLAEQPIDSGIRDRTGLKPPTGVNPSPLYLLGIDIGGTSIKWQLFTPSRPDDKGVESLKLEEIPDLKGSLPTDKGTKYADGKAFCDYIFSHIHDKIQTYNKDQEEKRSSDLKKEPCVGAAEAPAQSIDVEKLCVGVTWPGPVRGEPGREYVAGTSAICGKIEKLSSTITDNSPEGIHRLRIRENFVALFGHYVRLINDGDGHVKAAQARLEKKAGTVKRLMVVVAGTGTALGLIEYGAMTPFLNEIGKMIINLVEPFLKYQTKQGNFPAGVANQLFSQKTNPQIASDLLKLPMSNREVSWLWNLSQDIDYEMGSTSIEEWEKETFANLPAQLTWLIENKECKDRLRTVRKAQLLKDANKNAAELLERASWLAADLIAMCADILKADAVYLSGGPLTVIGEDLQKGAKKHLNEFYGFETDPSDEGHAMRNLTFLPFEAGETNAAEGAARAAWETFFSPSSAGDGDEPDEPSPEMDSLLFHRST